MLGQIPGAGEAIKSAANHSWEAVIIVIVILSCMTALVLMFKAQNSAALKREDRMALRLDTQDKTIEDMETKHAAAMVVQTKQVTDALNESSQAIREMRETLGRLDATNATVNDDLRDMINLMSVCPCLLVGKYRGKYQLVDTETGKPVDLQETEQG